MKEESKEVYTSLVKAGRRVCPIPLGLSGKKEPFIVLWARLKKWVKHMAREVPRLAPSPGDLWRLMLEGTRPARYPTSCRALLTPTSPLPVWAFVWLIVGGLLPGLLLASSAAPQASSQDPLLPLGLESLGYTPLPDPLPLQHRPAPPARLLEAHAPRVAVRSFFAPALSFLGRLRRDLQPLLPTPLTLIYSCLLMMFFTLIIFLIGFLCAQEVSHEAIQ